MNRLQYLRLISIFSALVVGFWLPLRILDFNLSPIYDLFFGIIIFAISGLNIFIHFKERDESFSNFKEWLHVGVIMDLICLTPFSLLYFVVFNSESLPLLLLNILAARHIWRVKSFLDEFDNIQPIVYRLVPLAMTMPLLVHLVACAWIGLGSGSAGPDADKVMEYIRAVYWSFTTLTTVGYGDITAKTGSQMMFTCGVQLVGVGVFGFILSNVASLLSRIDAAREHHMDNLDKVETFMKSHHIPRDLKSKVRGYYHYVWTQHRGYNDRAIIEDLPMKMQSELFFFINQSIVEKVPLLKGASRELLEDLMHELKPRIFVPGERIFRIDEPGDAIYFIHHGQIEIIGRDNTLIATLLDGAFFGEMALISEKPRSASAVATTYCDLYCLSKESFSHVLTAYPDFKHRVEEVARGRQTESQR